MRGQDKKRRTALLLAVLMLLMNCIPSYASVKGTEYNTGSGEYESEINITSDIQILESGEAETATEESTGVPVPEEEEAVASQDTGDEEIIAALLHLTEES